MKGVISFIAPLLIAVIIFFGILFFVDRKSGKGALQITSVPKSRVYLNNKLIGDTPLCACDAAQMLPVGEYNIKLVTNDGNFRPYEAKITINRETLTVIDRTFADSGGSDGSIISLIPLNNKNDVELLVVSMPDRANIFLDGNPVGVTPLLLKQVSLSDHDLKLALDGYKNKLIRIKTASGFRLSSLVFLGINADLSSSSLASASASLSPEAIISKVLILDTPTGFLRVRADNSVNSSEVTQIKPGESYELISEKEGWFEIKLGSPSGKINTGWISSQYAVKK